MTDTTARLLLPLMQPGQAQKEMTLNEALTLIDDAVAASVIDAGRDAPPEAPAAGDSWIVGEAASGAWEGQARWVATWSEAGWRFTAPWNGRRVWNQATRRFLVVVAGAWEDGVLRGSRIVVDDVQVVGARGAAVAAPSGGAVVDGEARFAIGEILARLRGHGLIAG